MAAAAGARSIANSIDRPRIVWVDILRFLGMTLIYWGHLGVSDNILLYIFAHHVPLFFFISGFFADLSPASGSFLQFFWKKIRALVFPYVFFTLLFYALQLLTGDLRSTSLPAALLVSAKGIRNQTPGPLWFLTCLFVVVVAFELIKRMVQVILGSGKAGKTVVLLIVALLYAVGICFLGHEPTQDPSWIWNVDSAFVYIFYYALGAFFFPVITRWSFRERRGPGKVLFFFFFAFACGFAVFTCLKGASFTMAMEGFFFRLVPNAAGHEALFEVYAMLSALILIFLELCIARLIGLIPGLRRALAFVGKDSLYHCGNELIIKYLGGTALSAAGLNVFMSHDLSLLFYSVLCLFALTFTLNLIERFALGSLFGTGRLLFRK